MIQSGKRKLQLCVRKGSGVEEKGSWEREREKVSERGRQRGRKGERESRRKEKGRRADKYIDVDTYKLSSSVCNNVVYKDQILQVSNL